MKVCFEDDSIPMLVFCEKTRFLYDSVLLTK